MQKPKREKAPSELGEEMVRYMLEDFAAEERAKEKTWQASAVAREKAAAPAKNSASSLGRAPTANAASALGRAPTNDPAFALASVPFQAGTGVFAGKQQKPDVYHTVSAAQYNSPQAAEPAAKTAAVPKAVPYANPAMAMPTIQKRKKAPSDLGDEMVARVLVEEELMDPKELDECLASFEEPSTRTFTAGVGRSDIIGADAYAARNAASGAFPSAAANNTGEDADPTQDMPEWMALMLKQDSNYPGLTEFTNLVGPWVGDQAKQLWDETHVEPGMPVSAYLFDKVGNAMDTVLEGAWNGIVDYAQAGVNADLERQKQQAQQFSFLGGPYQTYADQITDTARSIQEALPEAAEKFRIHKAAEQAQRIEIQKVGRDLQNDRGKALSSKETHDILNNKSDSTTHAQKEWWEEPGASEPIDPNDPAYQAMNAALTDDQRAAGLSVVKINGEYYVDVTIMINTRLQEVEQDFRNHGTHNQSIYNPAIFYPAIPNQGLRLANTAWFISQVNNNRPWDIKLEDPWLQQFGDVLKLKDMSETIAYNGQVVTPENLGNLTYGYLGRAMGWSEEALCLGGGVVNQKNLAEEEAKGVEGKIPQLITQLKFLNPSLYFDGSYGDEEKDTLFIKKGVELYEAVH